MSYQELTQRQRDLLTFIEKTVQQEQRFPSYREMAKALGVSAVGTVQDHMGALEERGIVEKSGKSWRLSGARQSPSISVPIVGEVAAGALQDAYEVAMGATTLSPELLKSRNLRTQDLFALKVRGESMIDAGIQPGDLVIIQRGNDCRSGDIVVADVEGETTLKELALPKKSSDPIRLIPHNSKLSEIQIPANEKFKILGKVISLQRYFS
jgi:repressor LexA